MKNRETPFPVKRPQPLPLPAGFVSHLLGSFRYSIENARDATSRLCQLSAVLSLSALAGWATGLLFLARGHSASGPLSPPAALCFLLLALALHNHNQDPLSSRTKVLLVLTALLAPLLATADARGLLNLILPAGNGAVAEAGRMWSQWSGVDPYTWVSLCWLSAAMALCPLFARQRLWGGDVLGAAVLFLVLVNGVFIFGYLHKAPISLFSSNNGSVPFLGCVSMLLLGLAVLGRLGPRHFPVRFLSGSSVRAVILRHFLPVAGAAVLIFDILNVSSYERIHLVFSSFLILLLSLVAVVYLSLRSAEVIGRRIEGSLRESEDRYAVLVDSLKDHAVLLLDPAGHILTWNRGAERIQGYGAEEVLGDPISRFYPPEEREAGKMEDAFKAAVLRGSHEEQGWRMRKDGTLFWAEVVTTPFMDDKNVLMGFSQVLRDISLRKKAEEAVKERETFMRLLQAVTAACNGAETLGEALPLVLDQVCLHTGWPAGHAWLPSPDGEEFVSGPWHLAEAARFADFRARTDRLRFPPDGGLPARVLSSGGAYWAPDLLTEKDSARKQEARDARVVSGYAFPVKLNGKTTAILEFFSERSEDLSPSWREALEAVSLQVERVMERDRAEQSLRSSEWRFRSLAQTANDAIVSYDAAGVIAGWNRGAKAIFGFEEEEILGRSLSRLVSDPSAAPAPKDGPRPDPMPGEFPSVFLIDMAGKTCELAAKRKNGEVFPIEVSVATWMSAGNVFFTAIMRDVTAHKKAQDILTASLREKEALLKEIHHRVKNNLQMISSLLRLQSENIQDPALLSIFLESQNRVRSMAIIHECLYQSPDLARMDFSDYVEKLGDNLLRTYSVDPEKSALRLEVDKVPLDLDVAIPCGLIITELVSNALKYAYPKGGGVIFIKFHALPGRQYELTVADEGVGLKGPVDFDSTDSLGLRLVHILTEQLRGRIRTENGVGAKFVINFKEPTGRP